MTMLSFRHFRAALFAMLAVAVLALAACSDKPAFKNLDITGSKSFGTDFSLTDHTGKRRTLEDFRGKVVVMFFGYTHCPDVCPTTLAELRAVMETLGKDADRVQVLFVTVDPERDTQDLLAKYAPAFDPRFIGLRPANEAELKKVASDFKVFYSKVPGSSPDNYTMDHSAGSYMFDPKGNLRLFIKHGQGPEPIAHDIKQLLAD